MFVRLVCVCDDLDSLFVFVMTLFVFVRLVCVCDDLDSFEQYWSGSL